MLDYVILLLERHLMVQRKGEAVFEGIATTGHVTFNSAVRAVVVGPVHVKGIGADLSFNPPFFHLLYDIVPILNKNAAGLPRMLTSGCNFWQPHTPMIGKHFVIS